MKTLLLYLVLFTTFVQCRKESEDCHFFITIQNNSNEEIIFSPLSTYCSSFKNDEILILSDQSVKYRPYPHPDCIENVLKLDSITEPLLIVDPLNYTTEAVPCEEFEARNTILRTYILTLEDLERLDYTINYPEDASIGVD